MKILELYSINVVPVNVIVETQELERLQAIVSPGSQIRKFKIDGETVKVGLRPVTDILLPEMEVARMENLQLKQSSCIMKNLQKVRKIRKTLMISLNQALGEGLT